MIQDVKVTSSAPKPAPEPEKKGASHTELYEAFLKAHQREGKKILRARAAAALCKGSSFDEVSSKIHEHSELMELMLTPINDTTRMLKLLAMIERHSRD